MNIYNKYILITIATVGVFLINYTNVEVYQEVFPTLISFM